MKIRTQYSYKKDSSSFEKVTGKSMTVPDMSYSIQELMDKFVQGIALPVERNVSYDERENLDFSDYDETRRGDFDLTDATKASTVIEENRLRYEELLNRKKELEAIETKKVSEAEKKELNELREKVKDLDK